MTMSPGLAVELVLLVLLAATIAYCAVLNRKLTRLRGAQDELRDIVDELSATTQNAQAAIQGLRETTDEAEARLADKLHKAKLLTNELSLLVERCGPAAAAVALRTAARAGGARTPLGRTG